MKVCKCIFFSQFSVKIYTVSSIRPLHRGDFNGVSPCIVAKTGIEISEKKKRNRFTFLSEPRLSHTLDECGHEQFGFRVIIDSYRNIGSG